MPLSLGFVIKWFCHVYIYVYDYAYFMLFFSQEAHTELPQNEIRSLSSLMRD